LYLRASEPYYTFDDVQKQYNRIEKEKWIYAKGFDSSVGKISSKRYFKLIDNFVTKDPSLPPINYKFRNINKEKWIGNKGFL